jgi:alpha-galactosidase
MLPTKIVVIGAGSASFGLNTLVSLMRSRLLRGSQLALVDHNQRILDLIGHLAIRLNHDWDAQMTISTYSHHTQALEGAEFVILSIETSPREGLWRQDYQIPLKYGVRQPYAENGGPGGFAHSIRNIGPVMDIVEQMEQICPQALLINFTNPMIRICDAIARYSVIKVVGLCHQIMVGYATIGKVLAQDLEIKVPEEFTNTSATPSLIPVKRFVARQAIEKIQIKAAGLNHFSWLMALHDKRTGADFYPTFLKRWHSYDLAFEPLTRKIFEAFEAFPITGDEHLCEYLPWVSDPITKPWEKFDLSLYDWDLWEKSRQEGYGEIERLINNQLPIDQFNNADSEGAMEIIENIAGARNHIHQAVNLSNQGYITNLPQEAIVEIPALVNGSGIHGVGVGELPEPVAELCRREITVTRLCVDAAIHGDRQAALQCLLLDPVITDLDIAQRILDDYLETFRQHLPQFWQ